MNRQNSLLLVAFILTGCSCPKPAPDYKPEAARSKIETALPAGWTAVPPTRDQAGKFKNSFTYPPTEAFTLLGPRPNYSEWTDKQGGTHRDYIHKECIFLWLTPGSYKPAFPRTTIFNFVDPPTRPCLVSESPELRIYGQVYQFTTDTNRAAQILKEATQIRCPDFQPSWANWRRDIAAALRK